MIRSPDRVRMNLGDQRATLSEIDKTPVQEWWRYGGIHCMLSSRFESCPLHKNAARVSGQNTQTNERIRQRNSKSIIPDGNLCRKGKAGEQKDLAVCYCAD
jgi:hypothetical protein